MTRLSFAFVLWLVWVDEHIFRCRWEWFCCMVRVPEYVIKAHELGIADATVLMLRVEGD